MLRIGCLWILTLSLLAAMACSAAESAEVTLDYVVQRALNRAKLPFHSPRADLPKILNQDNLNYDKYREIRFRRERALWSQGNFPFQVEFFHPGYIYTEPVHAYEFTLTHVQPVRFVRDFFDYGSLNIGSQIPANTGYAGFRVLYALNDPSRLDELGAFQGASYFRLLGKGQRYGESARGLALNCGESDRGEEFPIFTDWWLGKPHEDDTELRIYALLDSVSATGAYEFLIRPGETTVARIEAVMFLREADKIKAVNTNQAPIKTIGFAPLTSMFWFGKNTEHKFDDYRTEVHDSDTLLMHFGDEIVSRPLDNPPVMRHQIFNAPNIRGFGLLQRERDFSAYQDMFNLYHQVPSVWVEPTGNWGDGDLHLVELPTTYEGLDNIVAFWDPRKKPDPLTPLRFGYTLKWTKETDINLSENKVISTRIGPDAQFPGARQFVIDFAGSKLDTIPSDNPPVAIASCSGNAEIVDNNLVVRNVNMGSWRVYLKMRPKAGNHDPVDLRCTLQVQTNRVSETWTYQWSPP